MPDALHWQKSSYSAGAGDTNCLEIAATPTTIHIRDSKNPTGPHLTFPPTALNALLTAVKLTPSA